MNVLIVDDDRFVIASLKTGLPWSELGFDQIYTAFNIQEAERVIEDGQIDLILSDIDMPNGSGLDLLSWIRERRSEVPVIILTNYADFGYAQKALELKSFHYFLKPIEYDKLSAIIREAIGQLTMRQIQEKENCAYFWRSYLQGRIDHSPDQLPQILSQFLVPYSMESQFLPIVFDVLPYHLTEENTLSFHFSSRDALVSYMKTTFGAVFADVLGERDVFTEYDAAFSRYIAIVQVYDGTVSPALRIRCESFLETVRTQTDSGICCFMGLPAPLGSFHVNFAAFCSMIANQLGEGRGIVELAAFRQPSNDFPDFPSELLRQHLDNKQFHAFRNSCLDYLQRLSANRCLHEKSITSFQLNVDQMLYSFLNSKGIHADILYNNEAYHVLYHIAKKSYESMKLYIDYITGTIDAYFAQMASERSIAKSIKEYVDQHYTEEISRSDLSELLFVDAAYAVKLFKKEFGVSFKNYVIGKRIDMAKRLLQTTDLPINTISDSVGYGNYSYFTRIFKKLTGSTPMDFRSQSSAGQPDTKPETQRGAS